MKTGDNKDFWQRTAKSYGPFMKHSGTLYDAICERMRPGFRVSHKWTPHAYLGFLQNNGFTVTDKEIFGGVLTLTYAEAKKEDV